MSTLAATLPSASVTRRPRTISFYPLLFLAILLIKLLLLALDHTPMFFLGDSVAYLYTAKYHYIPTDRSFLYGFLIKPLALEPGSLFNLLLAQTLASAVAAFLVAYILRQFFCAPRLLAAAFALLCALEPLQLLYERYVMTESFALLFFALFTATALTYLQRPTLPLLLITQFGGLFLIAFRVSFLPLVIAATWLLPLLAIPHLRARSRPWRLAALHLLASLALFATLHTAYKHANAALIQHQLPDAPPAYYYDNGFHLLCFVAPIAEPQDFPIPDAADDIFQSIYDLKAPRLRAENRWLDGGLIANLQAAYPNHLQANRLAEATAWNALKRDPLGELRLAAGSYLDYFNLPHLRQGLVTDRGADRNLPYDLLAHLLTDYHLNASPYPHLSTLSNRWFFAAWPWYLALLLLPIPALLVIPFLPRSQRPAASLLLLFASLQILIVAAFSITPTVRFLHPTAWLATLLLGVALTRTLAQKRKKDAFPRPS